MKALKLIPNLLTGAGFLCGMAAAIIATQPIYYIDYAIYLILAAGFFDFVDGFAARLLKAPSEFGKQFDSLSDLVSFGIAPAMLIYAVLRSWMPETAFPSTNSILLAIPAVIYALAAAIRLAIFNTDSRQTENFRGIPSPAAALFVTTACLYWGNFSGDENAVLQISITALFAAAAMLIPIPFVSLKLKSAASKFMAVLMVLAGTLFFVLFSFEGIALLILLYIVASPAMFFFGRVFSDKT